MNAILRHAPALACAALLSLLLPAAAHAAKVTFRYQPVIGGVESVAVAGSFNAWNATANPMADPDRDGIWETSIELPPGRIEYKWVVNGDQWLTDEGAPEHSPDGFGGQNSIAVVGAEPLALGHGAAIRKAQAPKLGLHQVLFRFRPEGKPTTVHLAGTFNDWTIGRTALADTDGDGEWTTTLLLPVGSYQYKFVVNSSQWIQDQARQDGESDDGHGGKNSVINVDDRFPLIAVKRGDGDVFAEGILHVQSASEINPTGAGRVEFTARAHRDDVEGVDLVVWSGAESKSHPMRLINRDRVYEYYRADVTMPASASKYAFRYRDGKASRWLISAGLTPGVAGGAVPPDGADAGRFTFDPARFPVFETPEWVKHGVIYQIFPDRFRNGNPGNDPDFKEWYYQGKNIAPPAGTKINPEFQEYYHLVKDWNDYQVLTQSPHTPDGRDWMAFFGGDIEGVRQSLDYLKNLGVTILYFNPIFEAKSTHKYDGADFKKIDPHFGTNEEFKAFVKEAKAKGIRIVLDIVYNHSGNSHWAFKDAAEKGPASPYYQWFEFKRHPLPAGWPNVGRPWKPADYYYCWWGFGDLPDLNFDLAKNNDAEKSVKEMSEAQVNIPLVNHLIEATEYWIRDMDCDGVRLDVPGEVPFWFWKLYNQRVKAIKPDAYIVGELWGNASEYVRPGVYDAVMNYAFFKDPVQRFLGMAQGSAAEFDAALATGRLTYPSQAVEAQMNLIDSHDTPRFLTQVRGNVKRLLLAATFGMTYVGAPHIYYGDEIAMEGGRDPDCRRPFVWDWEKDPKRKAVHDYYVKLAAIRHAHPALRTGDFRTMHAGGMLYGYVRSAGGQDFLVALNAGQADAKMPLDLSAWGGSVRAVDLISGQAENWTAKSAVQVPGETGRIFKLERARGPAVKTAPKGARAATSRKAPVSKTRPQAPKKP